MAEGLLWGRLLICLLVLGKAGVPLLLKVSLEDGLFFFRNVRVEEEQFPLFFLTVADGFSLFRQEFCAVFFVK